ncbi:NAC domain-containing protein 2-like [Corylus avellana]|uniref:NAC domain-containing protein 2-like n=1 Tax=Corylus avellana TaxID=13451 RepID=UPI00286BB7F7|nr:NAC domain-containing protein 2-like [Corylus avellana]
MYFFNPNGTHPNRAVGDGFWMPSAADKQVKDLTNTLIGFKKTLVFYKGKFPKGESTNWLMHEYRIINPPFRPKIDQNDMKLDDWTLCRIYKKGQNRAEDEDAPHGVVGGGADDGLVPAHDELQAQVGQTGDNGPVPGLEIWEEYLIEENGLEF